MKKSQAALEFLMTYGWAFLVILILIGALSYFGVLNPTKFLPEKCMFSPEIRCTDYMVKFNAADDIDINLKLSNGLAQSVKILDVDINESGGVGGCTDVDIDESDHNYKDTVTDIDDAVSWSAGSTITIKATGCAFSGISSAGRKEKILVTITYFDSKLATLDEAQNFAHSVSGEVFAEVQ